MMDGDGNFAGVAAAELREEAGLVLGQKDLRDLVAESRLSESFVSPATAFASGTSSRAPAKADSAGGAGASDTGTCAGAVEGAASGESSPGAGSEDKWTPQGLYPSAGGCDEFIRLFSCERSIARPDLDRLQGRLGGISDEQICLRIVRYEDAWRMAPDFKTIGAMFLFERVVPKPGSPGWVEPEDMPSLVVEDGPPEGGGHGDSGDH